MKLIRTNQPVGMTILLVLLTILLGFILVPFILVVLACWLGRHLIPGSSSRRNSLRDRWEAQNRASAQDGETAAVSDDTIDCEVISARTLDENGQEIH